MESNQKTKQKVKLTATKKPNPRHASNQTTNITKHKLKYLEASRSSFLKLVFGKT